MTHPFSRYDLRTTDLESARTFYAATLGIDFTTTTAPLAIWPLHEQARARGVPSHWLGHIAVTDLAKTVESLVARGAQLLGPPVLRGADGEGYAVLRDPCEAVVSFRETAPRIARDAVAWHQLHTKDLDRSWSLYTDLFGWSEGGTIESPELPVEGGHRLFRYTTDGPAIGSIANTARLPGVHPHWLFHFAVSDLDATVAKITTHGGRALSPVAVPNGDRLVACEDPQGAAFGLIQLLTA